MKKVESELDITNRIIKILEKNDDISKLGAREIRISLDNIRKLLNQNKPLPPPPPKDREIHISGKSRHKR